MPGDVADEVAMAAVFDRAEAEFGGVDVHQKETTSQLTAIGDGPVYCTIQSLWLAAGSDAVVPVACFTNAGVPEKSDFSITFASSV
ncbi:hypothetical protein GCM10010170_033110 [Dactylosporangium salmoneum]|uniref:Uncharacterized protein n=1 Tax=Dactylosporangium salmoneum TaxID=53361 RepID=A0ABP5T671_9ACTN